MSEAKAGGERVWTGGCLCGGVRYAIDTHPEPISFCHCSQCRRQHSHVGAYTGLPRAALRLLNDATLTWYASSDRARRGFCACCGAGLFWEALDQPDTGGHIFVDHMGAYYDIGDDGVERRTSTGEVVE